MDLHSHRFLSRSHRPEHQNGKDKSKTENFLLKLRKCHHCLVYYSGCRHSRFILENRSEDHRRSDTFDRNIRTGFCRTRQLDRISAFSMPFYSRYHPLPFIWLLNSIGCQLSQIAIKRGYSRCTDMPGNHNCIDYWNYFRLYSGKNFLGSGRTAVFLVPLFKSSFERAAK